MILNFAFGMFRSRKLLCRNPSSFIADAEVARHAQPRLAAGPEVRLGRGLGTARLHSDLKKSTYLELAVRLSNKDRHQCGKGKLSSCLPFLEQFRWPRLNACCQSGCQKH